MAVGDQLSYESRPEKALAALEEARALTPRDPDVHCSIGYVLRWMRRKAESIAAFEKALALCDQALLLDPVNPALYAKKGDVLCWLHREADALATYDVLIHLDPREPASYCEKADALFWFKRDKEGRAVFYEAIELDPTCAQTYLSFARALNHNLHHDALVVCEHAIALNPRDDHAWSLKSNILWESMRYQESLVAIEEAIRLAPDIKIYHDSREMALCYIVPPEQASRRPKREQNP